METNGRLWNVKESYHDSRPFSPFHDEVILPTHTHSLISFIPFPFLYSFQPSHHVLNGREAPGSTDPAQ